MLCGPIVVPKKLNGKLDPKLDAKLGLPSDQFAAQTVSFCAAKLASRSPVARQFFTATT